MIKKRQIGFLVFASTAGIVLLLMLVMGPNDTQNRSKIQQIMRPTAMERSQNRPVHLYFADRDSQYLMAENRDLKSPQNPEFFAKSIIDALINGPQQGLTRTLPAATAIRAVFVTQEGICFVDFTAAVSENHPGGIQPEWLSIYSIVNSLVLNVSQIKAVKILINGNESETFAGHIDLQTPIKANMLLIR